ncbi:MAG TPA: phage portal protein, partial [Trebonia sp.]|nr:phage portal protein [Trebonia sp.]
MAVFASPQREKRVAQLAFVAPPIGAHINAVQDIYGRPGAPGYNMRHSVVWACEDLIASMLSTLQPWAFKLPPMGVSTPNPGQGGAGAAGTPVKVPNQPQILNEPAAGMDIQDWLYAATSALFRGNVYGSVLDRTPLGYPSQVELQDNSQVQVWKGPDGRPVYRFGGQMQDPATVWHRSIFRRAGQLTGMSILESARRAVQLGLNAEEFGNDFFEQGAHPSSLLTNEKLGDISQRDAATIKQKFMAAVHGSREPAVLTGGWNYQQVQVNPTDSQFLDTMSISDLKVCRYYRCPPEIIAVAISGQAITYANVEQRALDFL